MKLTVKDCYKLNNDFQNQFISSEVRPEPDYVKLRLSERTAHKVHYRDVYILEPKQFYKVYFEDLNEKSYQNKIVLIDDILLKNGLLYQYKKDVLYIFNASDNQVFLRKGTILGEVIYNG